MSLTQTLHFAKFNSFYKTTIVRKEAAMIFLDLKGFFCPLII